MLHIQTILFPTDDSTAARAARAVAERLAVRHNATLHVLRVDQVAPAGDLRPDQTQTPDTRTGNLVEVKRNAPSVADAITDYADEISADLIVMGTHGRSGWNRLALGSTAARVLRQSPCPVLTVGDQADPDVAGPVLAPVAFESSSDLALETAGALAADLGTSVVALHVIEPLEIPVPYAMTIEPSDWAHLHARVLDTLTQWVSGVDAAPVTAEIAHGTASLQIADMAEEIKAGLIVQASHGRRGLSRWLLGSVAEAVARRAPCPVLTLRADARQIVRPDDGMSLAVPRADWTELFDALSSHVTESSYQVSVEVTSPDAEGAVFRDVPLIGITYDARSDELAVIAEGSEHHVIRPFAVRSEAGAWTLPALGDPQAPGPWTLDVVGADGIRERITVRPVAEAVSA